MRLGTPFNMPLVGASTHPAPAAAVAHLSSHRITLGPLGGRSFLKTSPPASLIKRPPPRKSKALEEDNKASEEESRISGSREGIVSVSNIASMADLAGQGQGQGQGQDGRENSRDEKRRARRRLLSISREEWPAYSAERSELTAALYHRLVAIARDPTNPKSGRQQVLTALATAYRDLAAKRDGGGLSAVRQQLMQLAPKSPSAQVDSWSESLNLLLPLIFLNLQRTRSDSMLALSWSKASVMGTPKTSNTVRAPPVSNWNMAAHALIKT